MRSSGVREKRVFRTILVVDDDEGILRAYARTPRQDLTFLTAQNSASARDLARQHHPDLIIVDLQLGTESGLDLVHDLKAVEPNACVVVVSGYGSVDAAVRAMRAGADDVIEKPVTFREIMHRLEGDDDEASTFEPPTLQRAQWEHVQRVLADTNGNISMTARKLGVYRTTLRRWLGKSPPRH
jgi:two-component system response regulator RegA